MSLLLEAFKKAERAREEAKRAVPRAGAASASLELVTEPDPPRKPPVLALEPAPESAPASDAAEPARTEPARGEAAEALPKEPLAARPPFDAESRPLDPKLPFQIALGALGIAAIAAVGYFWYQLRPAPAFAQPPRPVAEKPAEPPTLTAPAASHASDAPGSTGKVLLPGLPPNVAARTPQPEPAPAPTPSPSKAAAVVKPKTLPEDADPPQDPPRPPGVRRASAAIHPRVQSGFAAYQAGDFAAAYAEYQQALHEDAGNRDALLGIAALETRAGRHDQAEIHYQRLLQSDPRDAHAHAGLLALRAERVDPVQAESRIKTMLAADAEANVLYFTLGNQYARQGRWAEAQLAFSKAHAADAGNPDFAFNLAVSFDHLRQPAAALEHYRRALELAATRAAHFALEPARQRVEQLSR